MSYEQIANLVSQVGFPIVVAGYLLIRTDKLLRELLKGIQSLTAVCERVEEGMRK